MVDAKARKLTEPVRLPSCLFKFARCETERCRMPGRRIVAGTSDPTHGDRLDIVECDLRVRDGGLSGSVSAINATALDDRPPAP
jgi:hypothetical protein